MSALNIDSGWPKRENKIQQIMSPLVGHQVTQFPEA
jgi:hypothetical protein